MTPEFPISVVIPCRNGGSGLIALVENLIHRQQPYSPEVILSDSGSRDGSPQYAEKMGARVVKVPPPFNHGLARDCGIRAATGIIVFLTVQDALPVSDGYIAGLLPHFSDVRVAGVSTRQVPPPGGPCELRIKAAFESLEYENHQKAHGSRVISTNLRDHPGYAGYSPEQKVELYRFDNVCSAIRKSVWDTIPFGTYQYAEDYLWARRVLEAGHTIVRDPQYPVIHAHRRGFGYEFRRALLDSWVMDREFGYKPGIFNKLNRLRALTGKLPQAGQAQSQSQNQPDFEWGARLRALRTYSAHGMARVGYRMCALMPHAWTDSVLKPMTRGI